MKLFGNSEYNEEKDLRFRKAVVTFNKVVYGLAAVAVVSYYASREGTRAALNAGVPVVVLNPPQTTDPS